MWKCKTHPRYDRIFHHRVENWLGLSWVSSQWDSMIHIFQVRYSVVRLNIDTPFSHEDIAISYIISITKWEGRDEKEQSWRIGCAECMVFRGTLNVNKTQLEVVGICAARSFSLGRAVNCRWINRSFEQTTMIESMRTKPFNQIVLAQPLTKIPSNNELSTLVLTKIWTRV